MHFPVQTAERQSVLKGFGCVDGEYPEKASDITPAKLEQITGIESQQTICIRYHIILDCVLPINYLNAVQY